jgi:hypothetical protein
MKRNIPPSCLSNFCKAKDKERGALDSSPPYKGHEGAKYGIPDSSRRRINDRALRAHHRRLPETARMVTDSITDLACSKVHRLRFACSVSRCRAASLVLLNSGRGAGVRDVIFPDDRKDIALTRNEAGIINRARLACHLTAQRAEIGHLTATPKKPMNKRADRAIADDVAQIIDPVGFTVVQGDTWTQKPEIDGLCVFVWP